MGRPITVHIDSDDLAEMLCERVNFWENSIPYGAFDLWYDFYTERVDEGVYDDMDDFSVSVIVDNDIVNYYSTYDKEDFIANYGVDPDDEEAMEDFRDSHDVYTDGEYFIVSSY